MPDTNTTPNSAKTETPDRGVQAADLIIEQTGGDHTDTSDTKPDYIDRAAEAGREGGSR